MRIVYYFLMAAILFHYEYKHQPWYFPPKVRQQPPYVPPINHHLLSNKSEHYLYHHSCCINRIGKSGKPFFMRNDGQYISPFSLRENEKEKTPERSNIYRGVLNYCLKSKASPNCTWRIWFLVNEKHKYH